MTKLEKDIRDTITHCDGWPIEIGKTTDLWSVTVYYSRSLADHSNINTFGRTLPSALARLRGRWTETNK